MRLFIVILIVFFCSEKSEAQLDTAGITIAGGINDDECRQVIELRDGGFVAVGSTASFGQGSSDVYLIKTDSKGFCLWSVVIGEQGIDKGYSVVEAFDGGLLIAGYTNDYGALGYDMLLIKTDSTGVLQWVKTYGGGDWDFGYSIKQTQDSGFVVCGESYSYSNGDADVFVVRTDLAGNLIWQKNIGGVSTESGYALAINRSGDYIIAGKTLSYGNGGSDAFVVALNQSGDTLWTKAYGSDGYEVAYDIDTTQDNGLVFVGVTDSLIAADSDGYFVKLDGTGNQQWYQVLGGNGDGVAYSVVQRMNGGYIICGSDNSYGAGGNGFSITRTDAGGFWQAGPTFGGPADEEGFSLALSSDGGAMFGGISTSYGLGFKDVYLIKLSSDSIVQDYILDVHICNDTPVVAAVENYFSEPALSGVYPNPFSEWTEIVIKHPSKGTHNYNFAVYSTMGEQVATISNIHSDKFRFHRNSLITGLYYYFIREKGIPVASGKFIIN